MAARVALAKLLPVLLAVGLLPNRPATAESPTWQADIQLNPGALAMFELRIAAASERRLAPSAHIAGYQSLRLDGTDTRRRGAQAQLHGDLSLRRGSRRIDLRDPLLRVDGAHNGVLLLDSRGEPWLSAEMPHRQPGSTLDWRFMDLRLLPEAARALGEPDLAGQAIGSLDLHGPATADVAAEAKGSTVCTPTAWPSPTTPADIALIDIPDVGALRCRNCGVQSTAGEVVIAPSARLQNVGATDVPWNAKFSPPVPPYDNDQHPFLVWSLIRIDADGRLYPLASSGVKHAFFATNDLCPCTGANVLFRPVVTGSGTEMCTDLYSASTNDVSGFLGPRGEIDAFSGRWGRCGSSFDGNCDSVQDAGAGAANLYDRRMVVTESELLANLHPDAHWWIEAWYVVRDDHNLDNSFAHREVVPTKIGSGWIFPFAAGNVHANGPALGAWVDPGQPTAERRSQRVDLGSGVAQLAVQVSATANGYRYQYALMNLDHSDAGFSGSEPGQLRLDSLRGALGLAFPAHRCTASAPQWRDGDASPGNDWQSATDGALATAASDGVGLGWGRLGVFEFTSPAPPLAGNVDVVAGDGSHHAVASLVPDPAGCQFRGGFEDGLD